MHLRSTRMWTLQRDIRVDLFLATGIACHAASSASRNADLNRAKKRERERGQDRVSRFSLREGRRTIEGGWKGRGIAFGSWWRGGRTKGKKRWRARGRATDRKGASRCRKSRVTGSEGPKIWLSESESILCPWERVPTLPSAQRTERQRLVNV